MVAVEFIFTNFANISFISIGLDVYAYIENFHGMKLSQIYDFHYFCNFYFHRSPYILPSFNLILILTQSVCG